MVLVSVTVIIHRAVTTSCGLCRCWEDVSWAQGSRFGSGCTGLCRWAVGWLGIARTGVKQRGTWGLVGPRPLLGHAGPGQPSAEGQLILALPCAGVLVVRPVCFPGPLSVHPPQLCCPEAARCGGGGGGPLPGRALGCMQACGSGSQERRPWEPGPEQPGLRTWMLAGP